MKITTERPSDLQAYNRNWPRSSSPRIHFSTVVGDAGNGFADMARDRAHISVVPAAAAWPL